PGHDVLEMLHDPVSPDPGEMDHEKGEHRERGGHADVARGCRQSGYEPEQIARPDEEEAREEIRKVPVALVADRLPGDLVPDVLDEDLEDGAPALRHGVL